MRTFEDSVLLWYETPLDPDELSGVLQPLTEMRSTVDEVPWTPTHWMYFLEGFHAHEKMLNAMVHLAWRVCTTLKDKHPDHALQWLSLWERLHHAQALHNRHTDSVEYMLSNRYNFVPSHRPEELALWSDWLAQRARDKIADNQDLAALVPFMAYYPWLDSIARSHSQACTFIESAIRQTFHDDSPAIFYAQHQWIVWSLHHRHPNDSYDTSSLMHWLFREHSLPQLACFWHANKKERPRSLLPEDIPKMWQRPLFAGCDINDAEMPEWFQSWVDVISTPHWAKRLSFWVTLLRVRRTNSAPSWVQRIVQEHPDEWKFLDTMHNWMSQMPPYVEPVLTKKNVETYHMDLLDYEYDFARALWSMYNEVQTIEEIPLPLLD